MALEQGLVMMIQAALLAQTPSVNVPGGYLVELPKDLISPQCRQAWKYRFITNDVGYTFGTGDAGLMAASIQFDCCGYEGKDAISLAYALRKVLRFGFRGPLPDPDATFVDSVFRHPTYVDGYTGDTNRTYVRSLEYVVNYIQI